MLLLGLLVFWFPGLPWPVVLLGLFPAAGCWFVPLPRFDPSGLPWLDPCGLPRFDPSGPPRSAGGELPLPPCERPWPVVAPSLPRTLTPSFVVVSTSICPVA